MRKKIITLILTWRLSLILFAYIGTLYIPFIKRFVAGKYGGLLPYYVWIWARLDGYHYMEIAQRGYQSLEYGFFPLYPLLIHILAVPFFSLIAYLIAGQLISTVFFLLALYFIYKLMRFDNQKRLFPLILLIMLFFPTSFFYVSVYNDSLFLFMATASIYFARKEKFVKSSILGFLATLTRLNGLALLPFILFEYINSTPWTWKKLVSTIKKRFTLKEIKNSKIYYSLLIPLAFTLYLGYIQYLEGSFMALFSSMKTWGQDKLTFPLQVFWRYIKIFISVNPHSFVFWVAVFELLFVFFYLGVVIFAYKKIRLSYWVFMVTCLLIPSFTGTFQGMPRYGLHLYPLFLSLALFLDRKNIVFKIVYFSISIILLALATGLFTRGYFIT